MTTSLKETARNLGAFAEMFITQEMPDRWRDGHPWETRTKNRIKAELLSTADNRRFVAAFVIEQAADITLNRENMSDEVAAFLDRLAGTQVLDDAAGILAEGIFDEILERLTTQGEAVLRDMLRRAEEDGLSA